MVENLTLIAGSQVATEIFFGNFSLFLWTLGQAFENANIKADKVYKNAIEFGP
jgi:hypothetical protein